VISLRPSRLRLPSPKLVLELRAGLEMASSLAVLPWLRANARPALPGGVLVLPGWGAGDGSTALLRRFLRSLGYWAHGWRQGRNLDPDQKLASALGDRLAQLADRHGAPVSLIGWSLGGVYARELAQRRPQHVARLVTLASPLRTQLAAGIGRHFERALGAAEGNVSLPTSALYSRSDGIVNWRIAQAEPGRRRESIAIETSHCGFANHPAALLVIADRLAEPLEAWQPYRPARSARIFGVRPAASPAS
jgi:pimeloyl-ACP methyl ester carboxylesterase